MTTAQLLQAGSVPLSVVPCRIAPLDATIFWPALHVAAVSALVSGSRGFSGGLEDIRSASVQHTWASHGRRDSAVRTIPLVGQRRLVRAFASFA